MENKDSEQLAVIKQLTELFEKQRGEDECYQEAYQALTHGDVELISTRPGRQRVRSFLSVWQLRERSTREAGIARLGFEITLRNLAARQPEERLLGWGFKSNDKTYVTFVAETSEGKRELVGCIRVTNSRQD